jgi:hypothetical protein
MPDLFDLIDEDAFAAEAFTPSDERPAADTASDLLASFEREGL